ncbi:uncharacterized protein ASPGLDRAFT_993080 [Aspergillus glaucus CBS 516.65]|uniref:Secreted protein n=1 Tax=Aspergillus glaucus CBS 516.65 TaxID=1160497 RepID=A0A1L9VV32_ASPGL|nr:hypothetical protein ASPGLDRAFT_993080 [Aspergillus glaucus CBS 516.65]OJJ87778.1 hypothetical protein ASPGLDRAFT_993080 [Aspergillus glaucus CBS 516.65]
MREYMPTMLLFSLANFLQPASFVLVLIQRTQGEHIMPKDLSMPRMLFSSSRRHAKSTIPRREHGTPPRSPPAQCLQRYQLSQFAGNLWKTLYKKKINHSGNVSMQRYTCGSFVLLCFCAMREI